MATQSRCRLSIALLVVATAWLVAPESEATPDPSHKLGVYSLKTYATTDLWTPRGTRLFDVKWKSDVDPYSPQQDPYHDFWNNMVCDQPQCAHASYSRRFENIEVTHANVVGQQEFVQDNWNEFRLVFFYGHNNFIVPPHPHEEFDYHRYNENGLNRWILHSTQDLGLLGWGATVPYDYHADMPVTNAATQPAGVVYLYNPFTSLLLGGGHDFVYGAWSHYRTTWNGPDQYYFSGGLGMPNLMWLILHGCQAVIVANEDGSAYDDRGRAAYHQTFGSNHIVLGHYRSFSVGELPDLGPFAIDLKAGSPVKPAYFALDGQYQTHNSAAISGEFLSSLCCYYWLGQWYCEFCYGISRMEDDSWTSPWSSALPDFEYVAWIADTI